MCFILIHPDFNRPTGHTIDNQAKFRRGDMKRDENTVPES